MQKMRKVTVVLPKILLDQAMEETGKGITETIREGLKRITRDRAYEGLRALRGKVNPKYPLEVLIDKQ